MATPPINPPFWMYNPPNPNMLVVDVAGYNAALSMGYTLTVNPPVIVGVAQPDPSAGAATTTSTDATGTTTVVDTSVNPQQPDPLQPIPQG